MSGDGPTPGPALAIVVACARPHLLPTLLEPLRGVSSSVVEVVVAGDVGSVPPDSLPFPTRLLAVADPHTNARRRAALAGSSAPLVAFLDDDATPSVGWLEAALAVDPAAALVITGPEEPAGTSGVARLVHSVSSSRLAEATRAHTATRPADLSWYDVPFCNCVVPRAVIDAAGLPSTEVPWDADDIEFFRRVRRFARFRCDPALRVVHDRYPDRVGEFLRSKWALRVRSGEKLVTHPRLYLAVPATLLAGAAPPLALLGLAVGRHRRSALIGAMATGYLLALAATVPGAVRRTSARSVPAHLGVLVALHVVSAGGVQVGVVRALAGRATGGPSRVRPVSAPVSIRVRPADPGSANGFRGSTGRPVASAG